MNLKDLNLKTSYISYGDDNIVHSLISPSLRVCKLYQRSVAFFSSSVFKLLISSLYEFISNEGKIELIISPNLSDEDVLAISLGYKDKELAVKCKFDEDFDKAIINFNVEELRILYEMILRGTLNIKVACVKKEVGIYHDKLGIMTDKENNKIVFYGSANSSLNAYQNNYEKVRVVFGWDGTNNILVNDEVSEFKSIWNNCNEFLEIYEFQEAIKQKIIREVERKKTQKNTDVVNLYDYQKEAIKNWVNNGYKGFYVMATGTGKTWTAIYSAKELLKVKNAMIVILAPYKHLVNQWKNNIYKLFSDAEIVMIYSDNTHWRDQATNAVLRRKYENKQLIFMSTILSFYSHDFQKILSLDSGEKLLIVDEAHRFTRRDEEVKKKFNYLLGLSATPSNGKNKDSKNELIKYFDKQVFTLPIEVALEKGFLVKYEYHPIFVNATQEEEERFKKCSRVIASCFDKFGGLINPDRLKETLRTRLRIISMAEEKMSSIESILSCFKNERNLIVYCGDGRMEDGGRYLDFIKSKLDKIGIKSSQFTASEDANTRMSLIESFNENMIDSLVAIRCLDEGVDIPSIRKALILSSNDDYREFVQRRGRILRHYKNKDIAYIYDIIVLPSHSTPGIAEIEFRRFNEYAKLAINYKDELKPKLDNLLGEYNLTIEDIEFNDDEQLEDDFDE